MVLDDKFPVDSEARGKLVLLLKTDVRKAFAAISASTNIEVIDLEHGSVIVHFRFVSDDGRAAWLEEEYLRQVDDKKSAIYAGEVTSRIDQKRTQVRASTARKPSLRTRHFLHADNDHGTGFKPQCPDAMRVQNR